jgi:large subunit ribosomal protein L1
MGQKSKRNREIDKVIGKQERFSISEAIDQLKKCPDVKFDQSVDISLKLGVDPRKSDQQVRGTVSLPNGTGKTTSVLVFAKGEKAKEALDAGADHAGDNELIDKVKGGWTDFDVVVATPDMMREVGKLGKVLGPKGLMPSPKAGTVTTAVATAVTEIKAGKVEFKVDRHSVINNQLGKLSFETSKLNENITVFLQAIMRSKPATSKGIYIHSLCLSSTMGPGLKIEPREYQTP